MNVKTKVVINGFNVASWAVQDHRDCPLTADMTIPTEDMARQLAEDLADWWVKETSHTICSGNEQTRMVNPVKTWDRNILTLTRTLESRIKTTKPSYRTIDGVMYTRTQTEVSPWVSVMERIRGAWGASHMAQKKETTHFQISPIQITEVVE